MQCPFLKDRWLRICNSYDVAKNLDSDGNCFWFDIDIRIMNVSMWKTIWIKFIKNEEEVGIWKLKCGRLKIDVLWTKAIHICRHVALSLLDPNYSCLITLIFFWPFWFVESEFWWQKLGVVARLPVKHLDWILFSGEQKHNFSRHINVIISLLVIGFTLKLSHSHP